MIFDKIIHVEYYFLRKNFLQSSCRTVEFKNTGFFTLMEEGVKFRFILKLTPNVKMECSI